MVLYYKCEVATMASRELMVMERIAAHRRLELLLERRNAARIAAARLENEVIVIE
jgi:hypothetical protein